MLLTHISLFRYFINSLWILYNAFYHIYLPPPTPPISTPYAPPPLPTLSSLLPSSGPACVVQLLLGVGPTSEYGQPTWGHIIKEYWLSLSQQLPNAHSFQLEVGCHAYFHPHTFCIARHHHPREGAAYRMRKKIFIIYASDRGVPRTYKEPKKLMIKKTNNSVKKMGHGIKMEILLISYSAHLIETKSGSNHYLDTWRHVSNYTQKEFHLQSKELFLISYKKILNSQILVNSLQNKVYQVGELNSHKLSVWGL